MDEEELTQAEGINPYAPTLQAAEPQLDLSDEETIRRKYIGHETNIKSIGGLFVLFAIAIFLVGIVIESLESPRGGGADPLSLVLWSTLATAQLIAAFGLYRFRPWARWLAIPISIIWLVGIGIGTLLGLFFLYLLLSPKGAYVFTDEYREIRKATPHVKYKMPVSSLIVIVCLVSIIAALVVVNFIRVTP